jgi:hypothetical protein
MAHYALLDENNVVTGVITGKGEGDLIDGQVVDWEAFYSNETGTTCKQTSYNTSANIHLLGGTPFRKNYAGIGYIYDPDRDAFYESQPYPSWTLNEQTCQWEPPVPYPTDAPATWNEGRQSWIYSKKGK